MVPLAACGDVNTVRDEAETAPVLLGDAALKGTAIFQLRATFPGKRANFPTFSPLEMWLEMSCHQ